MSKISIVGLLLLFAVPARGETFDIQVVEKAQAHEFDAATGAAKVTHNCVWGMTASQGFLWLGDVAGKSCMAEASQPNNVVYSHVSDPQVCICDFENTLYPFPLWVPSSVLHFIGDWRPPDCYQYNPLMNLMTRMTPNDPRISLTLGLRAAGANDDIVILGGPHLYKSAINLFAFEAKSGRYLGSATLPQYDIIRRWVRVGSTLYTAVGNTAGGGSVLRWTGTLRDPFQFDVVGSLDAAGAYLCEHKGRLFVTTWPQDEGAANFANSVLGGLWMSPPLGRTGLHASSANAWRKIWDVGSYEPDPTIAPFCGGGAVMSFGDYLYWGMMVGPGQALQALTTKYGDAVNTTESLANSSPATAIFRASRISSSRAPRIELLYGETNLPVYFPGKGWQLKPNRYHSATFGPAGFGNPFNAYAWSMEVFQGQLFVGTYDWNIMIRAGEVVRGEPVPDGLGGDLYCFPGAASPATAVTLDGAGNVFNNGFRNLQSLDDSLYIGTGNISDLPDLPGSNGRGGGWELLRLRK